MRQEDKLDEFDLKVRNLLENAEETVPPRVWDAVSSRLDREAATGRSAGGDVASRRLVRGIASFAVAAALVIGLLLSHNFDKDVTTPSQSVPEQELLADGALPPLPAGASLADDSLSGPDRSSVLRYPPRKSGLNAGVMQTGESSVKADGPEQPYLSPAQTDTSAMHAQPPKRQPAPSPKRQSAPSSPAEEPSDSDISLIAMAGWGDDGAPDRISRRLSIGLEGSLNVNDSRISNGRDVRSYMTSGTSSHTVTSIEEGSVSAYDIPLSFGLTVRYQFAPRFSVGTGITYSLVGRTFSGTYYEVEDGIPTRKIQGDIRHTMHYLGVPVNFYFDFVQAKAINCYVYAGGTADFCVSNRYAIEDVVFRDPVTNPQFSVGAGLGVQFRVSGLIGIYVDPGVRYFFRCDQPKSIRTDQPFMASFEAGLRFNL